MDASPPTSIGIFKTISDVPSVNRTIARTAVDVFGGRPKVTSSGYDFTERTIDILECRDSPVEGVTSYATVNLSDSPLVRNGQEYGTRLEMMGTCATRTSEFANIVSSAAAGVHHFGRFCAPGTIFPDVVAAYVDDTPMRHVMFVPPFLWDDGLRTLELADRTVAWLLTVPVSDAELKLAERDGPAKLEGLLDARQIDVFDTCRPCLAS